MLSWYESKGSLNIGIWVIDRRLKLEENVQHASNNDNIICDVIRKEMS